MKIGNNLKKFRELAGFTRKEAAEKLGVAVPTLSHWENDENEVSNDYLVKIKETYNVTIAELFGEVPNIPIDRISADSQIEKMLDFCDLDNVKTIDDLSANDKMLLDALLNKFIEKKKASTN